MPQEKNSRQQARTANRSRGGGSQDRRRRSRQGCGAPPAFAGGAPQGVPFPLRNRPSSDEPRRLPPNSYLPSGANAFPLASILPSGSTERTAGMTNDRHIKNRPVQMARGGLLRILTAYRFRRIGRRTRGRTSAGWIYPPAPSRICRTYTPSRPQASSRRIRDRTCPC